MALTPDERHAITDLFDRMRENGLAEKDPEAEALINQLVRRTPDSLYMLVQSVLIQETQLAEYEQYMDQQEERVRELEEQLAGNQRAPQQSSGGGFLGGARRQAGPVEPARYDDRRTGSGIPPIGSRSGPTPYSAPDRPVGGSPWANRGQAEPMSPTMPQRPGYPQPQAQPAAAGGGGFLRTAAAMAAGVAGGALLGNALGGMFGGNKGEAQAGQGNSAGQGNATTPNEPEYQSATDNDPGNADASTYDAGFEGGDWGAGGGGGGDDFEI